MGGGVSNISHKDKAELHHTDGITASQKTRLMTFIATKSSPMGEVLRTVLEEEHVIDPDTQTIPLDHTDNLHKVLDHVLHDMVEEAKTHRDDPTANALLVGPGRQDRQNQAIKKRVMQRFAYVPARAVTANEFCDIVEQVRFPTNMSCCSSPLTSEAACAGGAARGHRQEGQGTVRLPRRGQGTVAVATCLRPLVWGHPSSASIPLTTSASHPTPLLAGRSRTAGWKETKSRPAWTGCSPSKTSTSSTRCVPLLYPPLQLIHAPRLRAPYRVFCLTLTHVPTTLIGQSRSTWSGKR
jgi:hypothetical protein